MIFPLKTQMNRLFSKKSKKSPKLSQQHIFPGIVTNIAAGPLGFRAELDVDLKGEQGRSHRDLEADRADSLTMTLDGGPRTSQIVFHDKKSKDQALPAPGTSILGTVVGGEHGNDPSEFFQPCHRGQCSCGSLYFLPSEENIDITGKEKGKQAEASAGSYRYNYVVYGF